MILPKGCLPDLIERDILIGVGISCVVPILHLMVRVGENELFAKNVLKVKGV